MTEGIQKGGDRKVENDKETVTGTVIGDDEAVLPRRIHLNELLILKEPGLGYEIKT
jgi:hypothetical protein